MSQKHREEAPVKVLFGKNVVGGNCVAIYPERDTNRYVLLDHGINFSRFRKYYGRFLEPLHADEMRKLETLPRLDCVLGASEIYLSHLHLDHIGSLDYLDRDGARDKMVFMPMRDYYTDKLMESWRRSWKRVLVPENPSVKGNIRDVQELNTELVKAVKVPHSAYPSYSYAVFTEVGNILYTGDFRLHSLLEPFLEDPHAEELFKRMYGEEYDVLRELSETVEGYLDYLVIEGTNLGRPVTPLGPEDAARIIGRILPRKALTFVVHPLDVESVLLVSLVVRRVTDKREIFVCGKAISLYFSYVAHRLRIGEAFLEELGVTFAPKRALVPYYGSLMCSFREAMKRLAEGSGVVITDYETISIAREFVNRKPDKPICVVMLMSEPQVEELSIEFRRQLEWLKLARLQPIPLRVSGHYYPHELHDIYDALKPKTLIPIHTQAPKFFRAIFRDVEILS